MASILTIAVLLFAFGLIAQEVTNGKTSTFDRQVILALRSSTAASVPIGPKWLPEAARDATSLGSILVVGFITLAVVGYLFLTGKPAVGWLMLIAVVGGIALSDLLKFVFGRARPDFVTHVARVFTTSFPSGHGTLSAITYLTIGAVLAQSQPSFTVGLYFMSLAVFLTIVIGVIGTAMWVRAPPSLTQQWHAERCLEPDCLLIGVFVLTRDEVNPFTEKQIEFGRRTEPLRIVKHVSNFFRLNQPGERQAGIKLSTSS